MYCPYGNIVNFARTSRIHFCFKNSLKNVIQTSGKKNPQNLPFPLGTLTPHLIHQCLSRPHLATRLVHTLSHIYATTSSLVRMGCPTFTPKLPVCPFPSTISILRLTPLTTPNGIADPIGHFPTDHPADRPTDRQIGRQTDR